jgi:hypothetical protein
MGHSVLDKRLIYTFSGQKFMQLIHSVLKERIATKAENHQRHRVTSHEPVEYIIYLYLLVHIHTYIPLTLYPRRGSRGISDIPPRPPRFTKIS